MPLYPARPLSLSLLLSLLRFRRRAGRPASSLLAGEIAAPVLYFLLRRDSRPPDALSAESSRVSASSLRRNVSLIGVDL